LTTFLDLLTWARFIGWFLLGAIVYLVYGRRHARLALVRQATAAEDKAGPAG
jgi:APA family basic amino acid/polyamine antiporter